jgi:hypothetical protein
MAPPLPARGVVPPVLTGGTFPPAPGPPPLLAGRPPDPTVPPDETGAPPEPLTPPVPAAVPPDPRSACPPDPVVATTPPEPPDPAGRAPPIPEATPVPAVPGPATPPVGVPGPAPPTPLVPPTPPLPAETAGPPWPATPKIASSADPLSPEACPPSGPVMMFRFPKGRPLSSPHPVATRTVTTSRRVAWESCDPKERDARCMPSTRLNSRAIRPDGTADSQNVRIAARLPRRGPDRSSGAPIAKSVPGPPREDERCYGSATT